MDTSYCNAHSERVRVRGRLDGGINVHLIQ